MSTIDTAAVPKAPTPDELAGAIRLAWAAFVNSGGTPPAKRNNVYASSYRECDRRMVLDMTDGEKLKPFSPETLAKFRRGNDRERDLLADLAKIGRNCSPSFELEGQQERFELKDRKGRVVITGKVDARLKFQTAVRGRSRVPLEVKAWHPNLTAKVEKFEDLFNNRWTKAGAYQLLSYLYGSEEPVGFLLLDKSGIPTVIPVELYEHIDRMERFLRKAERAMDHKEAGTLPDFTTDAEECKVCDFFGSVCNPPVKTGAGAAIITDPETVTSVERFVELRAKLQEMGLEEYEALEAWTKKEFRGITMGLAGGVLIQGKWIKGKKLEAPADVIAGFEERSKLLKEDMKKFQVEDKESKFKLELTKVV